MRYNSFQFNLAIFFFFLFLRSFFHACTGWTFSRNECPPYISVFCNFFTQATFLYIILHHLFPLLFTSAFQPSSPLPYFYKMIPNHPHSYAPNVQTTLACLFSPHLSQSQHLTVPSTRRSCLYPLTL